MSLMLGNLVNRPEREGELPACLPAPWLLLCTAHSLSPQELKPSPHRFFGGIASQEVRERGRGREIEIERGRGGGRKKIMHKILFAERMKIEMNWGGGLMGLES